MMVQSSVRFELDTVFLHTNILKPAIRFYSRLFEHPIDNGAYNGPVYVMRTHNEVNILLDDHRLDLHHYDAKPQCMLRTNNLEGAFDAACDAGMRVVLPIVRGVGMRYFIVSDRDGNVLTVGDGTLSYPFSVPYESGISIRHSVSDVFMKVNDIDRAYEMYSRWLQQPCIVTADEERSRRIQMNNGVGIVLTRAMDEQPAPLFSLITNRLRDIRYRLLQDSSISVAASEPSAIQFIDADGNRIMVSEQ